MDLRKRPLILASASPQRRRLLKRLGLPFKIVPSRVGENVPEKDPRKLVLLLAKKKARAVARRYPKSLVLGSDTVVYCRGEILVKPRNLSDSRRILNLLNGRWHRVYTGVALAVDGGKKIHSEICVSRTKARRLAPEKLQSLAGKHMDKSGSYAMQDKRDPFIEKVIGGKDNVIGLPLSAVRRLLKRAK
ncbi:MAG: septum formation protein Maf [Elusimicrobia bacterium]|nr:septum formation protein Maf [Elusimicrobiota bacterium]